MEEALVASVARMNMSPLTEAPASLLSLPSELITQLIQVVNGKDALALARCCRTLHRIIRADAVWSEKLRSDWGFTEAGLSLWRTTGQTLVQAYDYFHRKHEPLECCLLREPQPAISPGWEGCVDLKVCLEIVNPWPVKVWTLFCVCAPDDQPPWAAAVDGRWQLPLCRDSAERLLCVGYAAAGARDAVLLSIAAEAEPRACPSQQPGATAAAALASLGWMPIGEQLSHAVPAVQGMLLPPAGACRLPPLAVLGEHTLRMDAEMWRACRAAGGQLSLHVMQCIDLRGYGLDLALEDASPYELCSCDGVQVPTTRASEHHRAPSARHFEWRASSHREAIEAEHRHETTKHLVLRREESDAAARWVFSMPGGTTVVQGGRELATEAVPPPSGCNLPPLTFQMLSHSRAAIVSDV